MTKLLVKLFIKNKDDVGNPKVRQSYGYLGSAVGILCNVLLFAAKFFAGIITASIAVTADAFNNLSDAGSSVVTFLGFKMASAPADDEHPFGHGRIEYISGLIVSLLIMLMGFELAKSSVNKLIHPEDVTFKWLSVIILAVSILTKLWMGFFNKKLGTIIDSAAMKASAADSLSDVLATGAVLVGTIISGLTRVNIDPYAGLIVALFILYTGFKTVQDTLSPLLGQKPDPEFVKEIEKKVLSYDHVVGIHDLVVHNYGPTRCLISLHAEVPCTIDIMHLHDTIDIIEKDLNESFSCESVIHMDPIVVDDAVTDETRDMIKSIVKKIDKSITIHDFRMVAGPTHTNLIFDVVVPHRFKMTDGEVVAAIKKRVKEIDEKYEVVVTIDQTYA